MSRYVMTCLAWCLTACFDLPLAGGAPADCAAEPCDPPPPDCPDPALHGVCDPPPPPCGPTQWDAANTLAKFYCDAHRETTECVADVVAGWCTGPTDPYCDALLCDSMLTLYSDTCLPQATAGSLPAACWTLFQF